MIGNIFDKTPVVKDHLRLTHSDSYKTHFKDARVAKAITHFACEKQSYGYCWYAKLLINSNKECCQRIASVENHYFSLNKNVHLLFK